MKKLYLSISFLLISSNLQAAQQILSPTEGTGNYMSGWEDKINAMFTELYASGGITLDAVPTNGNTTNTVSSDGVFDALAGKQGTLSNASTIAKITEAAGSPLWDGGAWPGNITIDAVPTNGNTGNAPSSDGVYDELALKANLAGATYSGNISAPGFISTADDGAKILSAINTVAITETATLGRFGWLTDRYWLANGTNWTTRYILDSSFIGSEVQAYDADLDDLADGSLTAAKVGNGLYVADDCTTVSSPATGAICFEY